MQIHITLAETFVKMQDNTGLLKTH